jgi:hypothetical protein
MQLLRRGGWLVVAGFLALSVFCCADDDDDNGEPDTTPPAKVEDLAAGSPTDSSITLTWKAPGDNGDEGTAASYDVRFKEEEAVTEANWSTATRAEGEPTPKVAGSDEQFVVTGLQGGTVYCFALKTTDGNSNESPISNSPCDTTTGGPPTVEELIEVSLHNTTRGMEYFYETAQGGFETLTDVPYDDLTCKNCHTGPTECAKCHTGGTEVSNENCLACHGRQGAEANQMISDVHRDAGKGCADCHDANDVHGDGLSHQSMLEPGVITAKCENCHDPATLADANDFHEKHLGETAQLAPIECSACHMQSVVSCVNCHFNSEIDGDGKIAYGQFKNWKFLVKNENTGYIAPANVMTLIYFHPDDQDYKAHIVFAPFYGHTIDRNAITDCDDCHDTVALQEYETNGEINVVTWDDEQEGFTHIEGIIPVPPDWETTLKFDFANLEQLDPRLWVKVEPAEIQRQMLFATPLDEMPD